MPNPSLPIGYKIPIQATDPDYGATSLNADHAYDVPSAGTVNAYVVGGGIQGNDGSDGNGVNAAYYCFGSVTVTAGQTITYHVGSPGAGGGLGNQSFVKRSGDTLPFARAQGSYQSSPTNLGSVKHAGGVGGSVSDSGAYPGGGGAPYGDGTADPSQCDATNGNDGTGLSGLGGRNLFSATIQALLTAAGFGQYGGDGGTGGGAGGDATAPGGGGGGGSPPSGPGGLGMRGVVILQFVPSATATRPGIVGSGIGGRMIAA